MVINEDNGVSISVVIRRKSSLTPNLSDEVLRKELEEENAEKINAELENIRKNNDRYYLF